MTLLTSRKRRTISPFRWYGSKARLMPHLIRLFPDHKLYISVFGGSGADITHKPRSKGEIYNDANSALGTFFKVLSDETLRRRLIARIGLTPVSRSCYAGFRQICQVGHPDAVEVALAMYYCQMWSYGGVDQSSAAARSFVVDPDRLIPPRWAEARWHIERIATRFRSVLVENLPWQRLIAKYDRPEALLYCDPPYVSVSRVAQQEYKHEMTIAQHEELLGDLHKVKGYVMLSGYDCDLYSSRLAKWRRVEFAVRTTASRVRAARTEVVWMNYDEDGERIEL